MIRRIIKKILPRPVIDFFIYHLYYKIYRRGYFAQSNLDKKLKKYIDYKNGFFVELGANDGIQQSNTYYFEQYRNWKGILIEPIGQRYLECFRNRSKNNKIFCNACVSFEYKEKFVELTYSNLMTTPNNLESDLSNPAEHAKSGLKYIPNKNDSEYRKNLRFLLEEKVDRDHYSLVSVGGNSSFQRRIWKWKFLVQKLEIEIEA